MNACAHGRTLLAAAGAVGLLGMGLGPSAADTSGSLTAIEMKTNDANAVIVHGTPGSADGHWFLRQGAPTSSVWWFATVAADPRPYTCMPSIALDGQAAYQGAALVPQSGEWGIPRMLWHYDGGGLTRLDTAAFTASVKSGTASIDFDCGGLGRATWSMPVSVIAAPPAGRTGGVSINDGRDFTNTPAVRLSLGWEDLGDPEGMIDAVKVSNDGGFAPSKTKEFALTEGGTVDWTLVKLGNERLPRQVYVKFHQAGGAWLKQTFSDDIVLDTVKPTIQAASVSPGGTSAAISARAVLRVRAKDNRSGVEAMQVRSGGKKGKVVPFRKAVPVAAGQVRVRVRDGAGNWSMWKVAS